MKARYIKWALLVVVISTMAFAQRNPQIPKNAWKRKVKLAMMGDLLVINTPEGLEEVWLLCARSPKLKPDGGHEYMALQSRNFARGEVVGKDVRIVFDNPRNQPRRDNEGRWMAYVYYTKQKDESEEPKTLLLNAEIIKKGLARVDTTQSCSKRPRMYELQRRARRKKLGLWSVPPE